MHGAVHRLEQKAVDFAVLQLVGKLAAGAAAFRKMVQGLALDNRRELGILVVREVPRGAVQIKLADVRREDLVVALLGQMFADEGLQLLTNNRALGRPKDKALTDRFVDVKQREVFAEFAVVAFLGFLQLGEVVLQLFFAWESGSVNALDLFFVLIAFQVGTCNVEQFERLDFLGV